MREGEMNLDDDEPTAAEFMDAAESVGVTRAKREAARRKAKARAPADGLEDVLGPKAAFYPSEYADFIDRSTATVWRLIRQGKIATIKIAGKHAISRGEALRHLREGDAQAA
jgi:hypothetical protein